MALLKLFQHKVYANGAKAKRVCSIKWAITQANKTMTLQSSSAGIYLYGLTLSVFKFKADLLA